jgi:hypothetical protein
MSLGEKTGSLSEERQAMRKAMANGTTEQKQAAINRYLTAVRQERSIRLQEAQQAKREAER